MKILIIGPFPPRKAAEADHTFYLSEHLAAHGLDVHVLTTEGSISAQHPKIRIHPIMKDWSWSDLARLKGMITHCAPDGVLLVYTRGVYDGHPMITFCATVCKTLLPDVPFVTLFEDAPNVPGAAQSGSLIMRAFWKGRAWARTLLHGPPVIVSTVRTGMALWAGKKNLDYRYGTLLRDSDRLIAVSERARAGLTARFSGVADKSVVIPTPPLLRMCPENNGAARQRWRKSLGIMPADLMFVYFGYVYPGKGVETLFKAFKIVSAQRSNLRLVMVGGDIDLRNHSSYIQAIRRMPREMGIDDRVKWTGGYAWDSDEGSGYLRAADVGVFPFDSGVSLHNSSFAAAAAHGLPVITTRGETLEEPFAHQKNVFLCPPKNPEAMALAMETLIDNPAMKQDLRAGVMELARECYSWETATERTLATFDGLFPNDERSWSLAANFKRQ